MKRSLLCSLAITLVAGYSGLAACTAEVEPPAAQQAAEVKAALAGAGGAAPQQVPQPPNPYTLFETLQVRPLALSPDGRLLFATNTPDNRLEIFRVARQGLESIGSVVVGLEPVAVAARSNNEIWVVNHLSDSVSIVRIDASGARVVRTISVGDEPRDIVFAGKKAFITTAHRGQNTGDDPDLFNPAAGRADVWVFDADNLGSAPRGTRLTKITVFADTPRALAASADGKTVYAASFFSGNQTTLVSPDAVRAVYPELMEGELFYMKWPFNSSTQPLTGLIVKYKDGHWLDDNGRNFDAWVTVSLPDNDVFAIDATANPPVAVTGRAYAHVGTTLFNAAVNPKNGKVYVSNTEAHNDVRFEGHNPSLPVTSVRGNIVDSRISVIDPANGSIVVANLNPHLDHAAGTGDASLSRAFPQDIVVSRDGTKLFVVAQGSAKLCMYDTVDIESGDATPTNENQALLSAGGPTGVVVNSDNTRAYVLTRFDNGISTVDLRSPSETAHITMFAPEPASVTAGRRFLYDATNTSALGDQACAGCHIGGDFDGLSWDLGDPGGSSLPIVPQDQQTYGTNVAKLATVFASRPPIVFNSVKPSLAPIGANHRPLKGPMATQSLRGMANHGAMHWRGDRNGSINQDGTPVIDPSTGLPVLSAQPDKGIFDEVKAFKSFNVAFPGLVGRATQLSDEEMAAFTNFILQVTYPPNPIRNLDDSLTPEQQAGFTFYTQTLPTDGNNTCMSCHVINRNGNAGATAHPGFFGSDGRLSFEVESQEMKVPHLRNMYQKVGMFSSSPDLNMVGTNHPGLNPGLNGALPAVRGFGFIHDGAAGTLEHFFTSQVFVQTLVPTPIIGINLPATPGGMPLYLRDANGQTVLDENGSPIPDPAGITLRQQLASFLLAFDSNARPIVGQQITLTRQNATAAAPTIALYEARAAIGDCDLIARANIAGFDAGFVYSNGQWQSEVSWAPPLSDAQLRAFVGTLTDAMTFTAVPPGSGWRIGVDRDSDGYTDLDELADGTNPADPNSHP